MTTVTEQYAEIANLTQAAAVTAFESWTKAVKDAFGSAPDAFAPVDLTASVDKFYDFAATALEAQRDFTKTVISTTTDVAETAKASYAEATQFGVRAA